MDTPRGSPSPTLPPPSPPAPDAAPAEETRLLARGAPEPLEPDTFQAARTHIEGAPKPVHVIASGGAAEAKAAFAAGTRIGPYEVQRELGRGSMGTVLAARHVDLGREAALKILSGALVSDPESVERFRRESEACASLDHPGIVRLYDRGEADGAHYFAMELVRGSSLEQVVRREHVPYMEAARIIAQCAHAIDFAHSQGVLHRDLKPANILLEASGRARITDFGLARIDRKATLTSDGVVVGTPLYLAPEVAKGERATRKSDIYSLGATLYELATGKPPYEGREARTVLMRVLNEAPIAPTDADPRVPRDLVRIIGKAMARNQDDRYQNARALALDLERFVEGRALQIAGGTAAFRETTAARAWKRFIFNASILAAMFAAFASIFWLNVERKQLQAESQRLARELEKAKKSGGVVAATDSHLDQQALHAAQDRDIRARIALKALTADATDENSQRSFDDLLARARAEREAGVAAGHLRQALQLLPHRWDVRLELAQACAAAAETDDCEAECTLAIVAPGATREQKLAARLLRAKVYRARGDLVSLWLAGTDLKLAFLARGPGSEGRHAIAGDLAFALAGTGDVKNAEGVLHEAARAEGDDLARVSLGRAAIARARNDVKTSDLELGRARDAATTEETRRLVEAFTR